MLFANSSGIKASANPRLVFSLLSFWWVYNQFSLSLFRPWGLKANHKLWNLQSAWSIILNLYVLLQRQFSQMPVSNVFANIFSLCFQPHWLISCKRCWPADLQRCWSAHFCRLMACRFTEHLKIHNEIPTIHQIVLYEVIHFSLWGLQPHANCSRTLSPAEWLCAVLLRGGQRLWISTYSELVTCSLKYSIGKFHVRIF